MVNTVSLDKYHRFCSKVSKTNMDMTRALVSAIRLTDEKKTTPVKEANLEKTVSNERQ